MSRNLAIAAAALIVVAAGWTHGQWTDRWHPSPMLSQSAERLNRVPLEIGDWRGRDRDLSELKHLRRAGIVAALLRDYTDPRTGKTVQVMVVCGKPGPLSTHTPESCYTNVGYTMEDTAVPEEFTAPGKPNQPFAYFRGDFKKKDKNSPGGGLRIDWSWSANGTWRVSSSPRLLFGKYPGLYKIYVIREQGIDEKSLRKDPGRDFLEQALPVLTKVLFQDKMAPGAAAQTAAR